MVHYRVILLGLSLLMSVGVFAGPSDDLRRRLVGGTHQSLSGQFIIHDAPVTDDYRLRLSGDPANFVQLDPALLAVSCERIKKALLTRLGTADNWRGKIYILLRHARDLNEDISVTPTLMANNWVYYLELPDLIERPRLIAAVTEVLLLEMASREADHSTEMPVWLVQGLSRELQVYSAADLVISPPNNLENGFNVSRVNKLTQPNEDIEKLRVRLRATLPLTIEQLSFPAAGQFSGGAGDVYRDSAQFFVHQLLAFKDGHSAMLAMIRELPAHLNWQLAFLHAFSADFSSQRDIEKWWDLSISEFCGRTLAQAWSSQETWNRLDETIHQEVEIRTGTHDLPLHSQLTLQQVLSEWEAPDRDDVLQEKMRELLLLQLRSSPDLAGLVANYRQALYNFAHRGDKRINVFAGKTLDAGRDDSSVHVLIKQLDQLDARRAQLHLQTQTTLSGQLPAAVNR